MKQKSLAALFLTVVLFSGFAIDWRAVADTALKPGPDRSAEEARIFEAVPRVQRVGTAGRTGLFEVRLDVPPETVSRAFLTYELAGVPHWTAAVRSVNGLPRHGSFEAVPSSGPSSGMTLQVEEINPSWLHPGVNQIAFFPAGDPETGDAVPYTVRNLRLVLAGQGVRPPSPRLAVTHPLRGEQGAEGAQVRGFVDPAVQLAGPAELFVNGTHVAGGIDLRDGAFAAFVPRTAVEDEPWEIEIEVVYPDGTRLRQRVRLPAASSRDDDDEPGDTAEADAGPGTAKSLALGKARLDVTADALAGKVKLTLRGLRPDDLPALDAGMTNVTPGKGGFRMGPHGLRFKKPVELTLPYDAALIPQGMTVADVQTFYFDEEAGRWIPLPRLDAKAGGDTITSLTDHFTDFINGTLALPDEPSGSNFSPNSIQELAKADPASEIVQIEPPEGGPMGGAMLDFPITVPPGRHGMEPKLGLHYDSSGGDGWLGMGWDLRLPSIEISTLFGVPRYDGTESYLMDGEQLAPSGEPGRFVRRVEGSFERIARMGSGPTDYWWEVTDKDGTRSIYGQTAQARLRDPGAGNTFRWHLERVIDLHGNTVDYSYTTDAGSNGEPWVEVYPAAISYTGGSGVSPFYQVQFVLDDGNQRPDRTSSGRQGFKTYRRHRLGRVDALAGGELVRRYLFQYQVGDFSKSLLQSVAVTGEDGATELYRHGFRYFSAPGGFGQPVSWGNLPGSVENRSFNAGGHVFVGIGDTSCANHVGAQVGGGGGLSTTFSAFLDANGDGLPDRLFDDDTVAFNHYDPVRGQGGFSGTSSFDGASSPANTVQWSFDLGLGAHLLAEQVTFGVNWAWSHGNDDRGVADVNGDGLPDLVGSGSVLFNNGSSFGGGLPMTSTGGGFGLSVSGERDDVLGNFKLSDPLRKLILPYDGTVAVTGAIEKKEEGGDGVGVEIFLNGTRLWQRTVAAGDRAACVPAPGNVCGDGLTLQVHRGDRLYFLAGSIAKTDQDALLWAPRVAYAEAWLLDNGPFPERTDVTGRQEEREPYGARRFVFDAADDFRLTGARNTLWSAPADGEVRVLGSIVKQVTSSDVWAHVEQRILIPHPIFPNQHIPLWITLKTQRLAAGDAGTFDMSLPGTRGVAKDDLIQFRLESPAGVDPVLLSWTPGVTYEGGSYCLPGGVCGPPACQADPASGQQVCTVAGTGGILQEIITQQVGVRMEELFPALWNQPGEVLSGGYHGWLYGEWNGNLPFDESGLRPPESRDDKPPYLAGQPRPAGITGLAVPVWTASGFDFYLAAEEVKPSRQGRDAATELEQANSTGGGVGLVRKTTGVTVGIQASAAGAGASLSCGASDTQLDLVDLNGDGYPDQVSGGSDLTTSIDGLSGCVGLTTLGFHPDGAVRLADGRGGFAGSMSFSGLEAPVRRTADANVGLNFGLGINVPRKDGQGNTKSVVSTTPSVGSALSLSQTTTDLIDVNGDGLPDRVSMAPGADHVEVRLNLGYRFGGEEDWPLPRWQDGEASCDDVLEPGTGELANLTSFGTFDALRHTSSGVVNAGAAFGPFGGGVGTTLSRTLVELTDVNGDGLPDHVAKDDDGAFRVKLNLGDHWGDEQTWTDSFDWPGSAADHHAGLFQCRDALSSTGDVNGNGSVGAPICIPLLVVGIQIEISVQLSGAQGGGEISFEDFDGDGLADRVLKGRDSTVYVKPNQAQKANLLVGIDRPLGGTVALEYKRQGNRVDRSDPNHKIDMQSNQWALAATVLADGRSHEYRTEYEYFNDAFYDRAERESYGYAHVRTTLPDRSTIDRYFHNQSFYSRHQMTREVLADAAGNLFQVQTARYVEVPDSGASRFPALVAETSDFYEINENTPKSTQKIYEYDGQGNVTCFVDFADSGDEDNVKARIGYTRYATWVTRPSSIEVKDGPSNGSHGNACDGPGRLLRQRKGVFDPAGKGDLMSLEQTLIGGNDPETGAAYSGSRNPVWTFSYDGAGNLASAADPTGFRSDFTYDFTVRTYPVEVRDSFGYVTRNSYNLKYGNLTETIDENGNRLGRAYDSFGRLIRVVGPYDSDATPTLAFEYGPGKPISWAVVHHKDTTRSDPIDSATFIDSMGRVLQTKEDAELDLGSGTSTRSGMRVSGRVEFDVKGRVASTGQPVFDSGTAYQFGDVPARNPTAVAYDILDRVREVRFPHGAVTRVDYGFAILDGVNRLRTTRTDPAGRTTKLYRDIQGEVMAVEQFNTIGGVGKTLVTRYDHDALNQLTSVRDAKGSTTRLEYDTLGRNVILDNPDLGRTESRFDPAGNLKAKITANLAARGQQIRYLYTFSRLDRIDYPQSPDVALTYGPPGASFNRANRIATVTDESGVEERSYDKLGEVVQTVKTTTALNGNTPRGPYTTRFQFDSFNRLLSVVYPDGETLTYGYDAGGNVKSASGVLRGARFEYLRLMGYDEFGDRARVIYGNGVETRFAYDSQSRFLAQLRTTGAGRDLQNLRYQYDLTGTVQTIQNNVPVPSPSLYGGPASQTFQYDDLYQLVGAQGTYRSAPNKTSSYTLALAYDEVGNTTAKNQFHQTANGGGNPKPEKKTTYNWAYAYGGPQPHAPTRIGDRTFRYDLDGNQTGWDSDVNGTRRTLTWNEENRLVSVADNGQTTRFLYDAGGMRTNKAGQHGETTYVNRWFSIRNGAIASKHVFADDIRLSTKVSPAPNPPSEKVYFYQGDHLGSAQLITDDQGTVYQHLEYFPSGEIWVDERSETQRTPYLFSGKELDEETGLSYFGFRYYEARQGQWISADPSLDKMLNTVRLARPDLSDYPFRLTGLLYGYVDNSPINQVDPLGLSGKGPGKNLKRRLSALTSDANPSSEAPSPSPSSSSSSSSAVNAPTAPTKAYRVLRAHENPEQGLFARDQNAEKTPEGHVLHGSKKKFKSQFISTTTNLEIAKSWSYGKRVAVIDLTKVQSDNIIDLSSEAGRDQHLKGTTAKNRASSSAEVLVKRSIPAVAVKLLQENKDNN